MQARGRRAATLILLVLAVLIGWLVHSPETKTVTRTVARPPATIYQHTPAGAVAAAQSYLATLAASPTPARSSFPANGPGKTAGDWSLGWRMKAYSPAAARVETWGVEFQAGFGTAGVTWALRDVEVRWSGREWQQTGDVVITPCCSPPPDGAVGAPDTTFGQLLSSLKRFPGAP
jgi:hypothetical protein